MDIALAPLVGLILSGLFVQIPLEIGILLQAGKKLNGKWSLKGIIGYTKKSMIKDYLIYIPILIIYSIIMFVVVAPPINDFMVNTLFWWYPHEYNFQNIIADPLLLAGYQGVLYGLILYIIIFGIVGPFVEELYFRGYLLPRMEEYAKKWAPLVSTVLFSVYHFFSPWENPIRIIQGFPLFYLVWKKKDIRFGIIAHILLNSFGGIMMMLFLL
jgi:membrane protease YdiL (CAAX protease family)